jgi:hypothetical protein
MSAGWPTAHGRSPGRAQEKAPSKAIRTGLKQTEAVRGLGCLRDSAHARGHPRCQLPRSSRAREGAPFHNSHSANYFRPIGKVFPKSISARPHGGLYRTR